MAKLSDINLLDVGHTIQMAGTVYVGNGKAYLVMFPEHQASLYTYPGDGEPYLNFGDGRDNTLLEELDMSEEGAWEKFLRQTDLLETEILAQAEDGKLVKAIIRKSTREISQGVSWQVYKRDGYACRYCGNDSVPLTVDHLVLWEEGGPSEVANLLSSCRKCNKTRGNMQYAMWLQHPYYLKVSRQLSAETRQANHEIQHTLAAIPRRIHKQSR